MHKHMLRITLCPVIRQQCRQRFRRQLTSKLCSQSPKLCGGQTGNVSKVRDFHIVKAAQRSHLQNQIADVCEGFKMMPFSAGDNRVQNCHPIASSLTAYELPILSANGNLSVGALKPATCGRVQNQQVNGRSVKVYSAVGDAGLPSPP